MLTHVFVWLGWLCGWLIFWKVSSPKRNTSHQNQESSSSSPLPVSVIIPARNEAHNLPQLLTSLQQESAAEVLVIDDGSTDETAEVAKRYGATVVTVTDKPAGWNGKSYACWLGAKTSTQPILLFLDADTWLVKGGLTRLIETWQPQKGLLAVQPWHKTEQSYESLAAVTNVMVMAGMNAFTPLGQRWTPMGAFGPCIICDRDEYFQTGGHEAVRTELLEDIPFGKNFRKEGLSLRCVGGRGSVHFRMYPNGFREMLEGFSKSFAIGAGGTHPLLMLFAILWISGASTAIGAPFILGPVGVAYYAMFALQMFVHIRRTGGFAWWTSLLYPLSLLFFLTVQIHSFLSIYVFKKTSWKGRIIQHN